MPGTRARLDGEIATARSAERTIVQDLNDLRFFAAVVNHGGFSAAARELRVPKSRVSRRVALMEEQLGVRLLERNTRRVALTEVGKQVFEHARAAVIEADAVDDVVLRMQAEPRGLVRISCPLGIEPVLAARLPGFLTAYPQLRVQCIVTNRRVDLIEEGIDIAVRVREQLDTDPTLQMRRVGISRRILAASPALAQTLSGVKTPSGLQDYPLIDHAESRVHAWRLTGPDGAVETVTVEPRFSTGSFDLLLAAARTGLGIVYLPDSNCRHDLDAGTLVRVLPEWSGADGIVHLVFTSRRGMLPSVRAVIEFAAEQLKIAMP
jgi:DNA-binding transcriptional LysR family regulator